MHQEDEWRRILRCRKCAALALRQRVTGKSLAQTYSSLILLYRVILGNESTPPDNIVAELYQSNVSFAGL